ncbi:unnamed protein product, partial [Coregonus sp. 'balchen']
MYWLPLAEGLWECTTGEGDNKGHTTPHLARIWCHRGIASLSSMSLCFCGDLPQVASQKLIENKVMWVDKKGLPLLWDIPTATWNQAPAQCLSIDQGPHSQGTKVRHRQHPGAPPWEAWNISPNPSKSPPASVSRPQGVRLSNQPK